MTDDTPTCPHCGADLTDRWISFEADMGMAGDWETEMRCPTCGKDMTQPRVTVDD